MVGTGTIIARRGMVASHRSRTSDRRTSVLPLGRGPDPVDMECTGEPKLTPDRRSDQLWCLRDDLAADSAQSAGARAWRESPSPPTCAPPRGPCTRWLPTGPVWWIFGAELPPHWASRGDPGVPQGGRAGSVWGSDVLSR